MDIEETEAKNDFTGEDQQQFNRSTDFWARTSLNFLYEAFITP
jgi:hypothetical protein